MKLEMEIRDNILPVLSPKGGDEEVEAIREVIESGWWGKGPKVAQFEEQFAEMVGQRIWR
jgi:perosamine synthetase